MPKSLADGHLKFTILTTKPADLTAIPVATLNAGIDASCAVLASDFTFSAADSDKVNEKALCTTNNANAIGASNFTAGVTAFRYFDAATGAVDPAEDTLFAALKTKGTELWGYARKSGKESTDAWEADDEIYLGLKVITDEPQSPSDQGGYIKFRVPMEPQEGYPFITAAAGV